MELTAALQKLDQLQRKQLAYSHAMGLIDYDGMTAAPDSTPNQTQKALQILRDIAVGKTHSEMSANFAAKVSDAFRKQLAENLKQMRSFVYLGREKITTDHFMLDATAAEFVRYRMTLAGKNVYYYFRMNKEDKIGWIIYED